jgi:hypothetical protein
MLQSIPQRTCQELLDSLCRIQSLTIPMLLNLRNSRFTNLNLSLSGRVTDEWMILLRDLPLVRLNLSHCLLTNKSMTYFKPVINHIHENNNNNNNNTTGTSNRKRRNSSNSKSNGKNKKNYYNKKNLNDRFKNRGRSNSSPNMPLSSMQDSRKNQRVILQNFEICDTLTSLNLSSCHEISYEGLLCITSSFSNLKILILEGCHGITNKCLELFSSNQTSEQFKNNLQVLNVRHCKKISCAGVKHLTALKNLQILNLADNEKVSIDSMRYIGQSLHQLTQLNIRNNVKITCSALKFLNRCTQLKIIDISGIERLESLDFLIVYHNNSNNNNNKKKKKSSTSAREYISSSQVSSDTEDSSNSLDENEEEADDINSLEQSFDFKPSFPNLTHLNISETPITSDTIANASHLFQYDDKIRREWQENNNSGNNGVRYPPNGIFLQLKHLALNYCKQLSPESISQLISHCPQLTSLELSSTLITDATLQSLSHCNSTLESLDISFCKNITNHSFKHYISKCHSLKHLYSKSLRQINVKNGWKYLFRNCNSQLQTLCLPNCLSGDDNIYRKSFLQMSLLSNTLTLLDLSFSENQLTDSLLNSVLPELHQLTWLDLTSCYKITSSVIVNSIIKLKNLSHLALSDCPSIDPETGITQLSVMSQLECLYISSSNITNEHLKTLCSGNLTRLTDLSVMNCKYLQAPESIRIISRGFPKLNALNLYGLPIGDRGVYYLKQLKNLNRLRMSTCDQLFTEKSEQYLHELENLVYFKSRDLPNTFNGYEMKFQRL